MACIICQKLTAQFTDARILAAGMPTGHPAYRLVLRAERALHRHMVRCHGVVELPPGWAAEWTLEQVRARV